MAILFKNNAASTLTYKMTDVQEVLYVADASVFPVIASDSGDVFKLTLVGDDTLEIVEAFEVYNPEGRQGFKIRRAQEGTTAQAWPVGTRVEMRITAGALQSFFSTIATTEKLGVSKLSTHQQAIEGIDNTTNMTPRRTVDAIHQFNTTVVETPVESEQTYTWTNAPRVGSNVPSYTRVVIYRKSDNAVVFTKETGIDATTCVIPANTLAHNTEYHCHIDNWFVEGGQLDAEDMTKFTSKTTGFVTSYPAVWQAYRSSTTYSVPYTGTYDVVAIGGGACSAYGGYIAGGGGAGALGSLMEPSEWATPGWANDSYTHPANAGAGQVGCVLIISTWAL